MSAVFALATAEFRIAMRNRWVAVGVAVMVLFSLVLSAVGSAPTGVLGSDKLSVVVASLTGLAVYLVPLIALLMSFDAIAGEVERGTLPLILTYPLPRAGILLGKFLAHLCILAVALAVGFGVAAAGALYADAGAVAGLPALGRLFWTSLLLGATFLAIGYAVSALALRPAAAAGMAIGVWLVLIVLFDLGLLAAIVADDGGTFTKSVFPWLLIGNPADAFRLYNLSASQATSAASGLAGAATVIPSGQALSSILIWPGVGFALALAAFRKVAP